MKKITFFVMNIFKGGGVQRVVSILANKLTQYNKYEISIVSLFKNSDKPFFTLDSRIKVYNILNEPFDFRKKYFSIIKCFEEFIKNHEVDIFINAGMGSICITYPILRKMKNTKFIAWEHQNYYFGKKFGTEWIGKRIARRKADSIVVLTKYDFNNYKNNLKRVRILNQIYNPIEEYDRNEQYKSDSKKIISCGSFSNQKGFDILVDVAKYVFEKYPDWQWHIWGDGEERRIIEKKIKDYCLEKNVILKGYSNSIYDEYYKYSMYVMTSRHEGFPMVLLEAQANKLPIISFDCKCGPLEIIDNGKNGYLVECFNIEEMSKRICELIENRKNRIEFSKYAFLKQQNFNCNKIVNDWINIIDNL